MAGESQPRGKAFRQPDTRAFMFVVSFTAVGENQTLGNTTTLTQRLEELREPGGVLFQRCYTGRKKLMLITAPFLLLCHVFTTKEGAISAKFMVSLCNAGKQTTSRQPSSKQHLPGL